jgi:cellulose synthase/poly-beta-1,6-N-acetylglucosamine synthase-like glycosyltransferase
MTLTSQNIMTSVIVPTYSRPVYLRDTVISLLQQKFPSEQYEIIVVDNKPSAGVHQIVQELEEEWQRTIRYVEERKKGLFNARHTGAKAARAEILVYVDDDIIAPSGWLSAILEPFKHPHVALISGKVVPKWEVQPPGWLMQFPSSYLSLLDLGDETQELKWPKGVYGCNMAVRRSTLYEVGGFNPDFMGDRLLIGLVGDGETGLHKKICEAGYKVLYTPRAWLYHRIPPERLKMRAFYNRGLLVGLNWSYTHIRNTGGQRLFAFRAICRAFLAFLRAIRCCIKAVFQRNRRVRCISDAWLWYGYGIQQLYAAINPRVRAFFLKDSYLR